MNEMTTPDRNAFALANSLAQILQKTDRILTGNERVKVTANVMEPNSWSVANDIALGFRGLNLTNQEDITCAIGLNYHELAHVCLTPRNSSDALHLKSEKTGLPRYVFSAFNYLEDARIETLFGARYDAMRYYFTVTFIAKILRDDDMLSQHVANNGGDPKLLTLSAHLLAHGRRFLPSDIRTELRTRALRDWTAPGDANRIADAEKIFDQYRTMTRKELGEFAPLNIPGRAIPFKAPRYALAASRLHDLFPELFVLPNDHGRCAQTAANGNPHGGIGQNSVTKETAKDKRDEDKDSEKAKQDQDDDYEEIELPEDQEDDEDDQDDQTGEDEETDSGEDQNQDDDGDAQSQSEGDDDPGELGDDKDDDQDDGDGDEGDDDGDTQDGSNRSREDSGGQEGQDDDSDAQSASGGSGDPSEGDDDGDPGDGGTGDASGDGDGGDQEANGAGAGADANSPLTDSEMNDALQSVMNSVIDNSVISSEVDRIAQDVARIGETSDDNFTVRTEHPDGEVTGAISELSMILSGLQDRVAPGWNYGSDHGRLNVGRVMAGADFEEIYDEWDEGREDDASSEVVFLLDQSVSMNGAPIYSASRVLHTLRSALLSIDANVSIYGFSTKIVNVLKGRDDKSVTEDVPIFGTISGTEIKNAMSYAVDVFNESDAKNRILIVITDGMWTDNTSGYYSGTGLDDEHRRLLSDMNATKVLCFIGKEKFVGDPFLGPLVENVEKEFDFSFDAANPSDLLAPIATVVERVVTNSVS